MPPLVARPRRFDGVAVLRRDPIVVSLRCLGLLSGGGRAARSVGRARSQVRENSRRGDAPQDHLSQLGELRQLAAFVGSFGQDLWAHSPANNDCDRPTAGRQHQRPGGEIEQIHKTQAVEPGRRPPRILTRAFDFRTSVRFLDSQPSHGIRQEVEKPPFCPPIHAAPGRSVVGTEVATAGHGAGRMKARRKDVARDIARQKCGTCES